MDANKFIQDGEENIVGEQNIDLFKLLITKGNRLGITCFLGLIFMNSLILFFIYEKVLGIFNGSSILLTILVLLVILFVILGFNIALSYSSIDILNKIYEKIPVDDINKKKNNKSDAIETFTLFINLFWTSSFIIWLGILCLLLEINTYLIVIFLAGAYIPYKVGRYYICKLSSLLYRTFQPNREIQIDYDGLYK